MPLSPRALKAISGAGAVAICGISAALVAIDPKPEAAPLRPALSPQIATAPAPLIALSARGLNGMATRS